MSAAAGGQAIETSGATDVGTVREDNQDEWRVVELGGGGVALIVADGMGGHVGGGDAARAAVDAAAAAIAAASDDQAPADAIAAAARAASDAVAQVRARIGGRPGTTLVLAVVGADGAFTVGNIGDSRAYLVRPDAAIPLTQDHSWVGEQVRQGALTPADVRRHPRRNVITRAVMGDGELADVFTGRLAAGDVLLLCSDGVWEPLADDALPPLCAVDAIDGAAARVDEAALRAGSRDNVTTVLARLAR